MRKNRIIIDENTTATIRQWAIIYKDRDGKGKLLWRNRLKNGLKIEIDEIVRRAVKEK